MDSTQLALRSELMAQGYDVGQLGTEHQSALFGFDFTFPNGYDSAQNLHVPLEHHISFLQSVMVGIERKNPNILIVGGQSGLVPYSFGKKSPRYSLASLMILLGTVPDAYILVVNSTDDLEYIQETMHVLKGLGKGEVILLVFSNKSRETKMGLGGPYVVQEHLSAQEIHETMKRLEDTFDIPATEIISKKGRQKMTQTVINYFSVVR